MRAGNEGNHTCKIQSTVVKVKAAKQEQTGFYGCSCTWQRACLPLGLRTNADLVHDGEDETQTTTELLFLDQVGYCAISH